VIVPPIRATSRDAIVKPRPVPPYLRRRGSVLLLEGPEDSHLLVGAGWPMPVSRTASARLTSPSPLPLSPRGGGEGVRGCGVAGDFHAHDYLAVVGELDGVAHQVEQDLPQPADVADQGIGQSCCTWADSAPALSCGPAGLGPARYRPAPPATRSRRGPAPACRPRSWRSRVGR